MDIVEKLARKVVDQERNPESLNVDIIDIERRGSFYSMLSDLYLEKFEKNKTDGTYATNCQNYTISAAKLSGDDGKLLEIAKKYSDKDIYMAGAAILATNDTGLKMDMLTGLAEKSGHFLEKMKSIYDDAGVKVDKGMLKKFSQNYVEQGDVKSVLSAYSMMGEEVPNDVLLSAGWKAIENGDSYNARISFERTENEDGMISLGKLYVANGHMKDAKEIFKKYGRKDLVKSAETLVG